MGTVNRFQAPATKEPRLKIPKELYKKLTRKYEQIIDAKADQKGTLFNVNMMNQESNSEIDRADHQSENDENSLETVIRKSHVVLSKLEQVELPLI